MAELKDMIVNGSLEINGTTNIEKFSCFIR